MTPGKRKATSMQDPDTSRTSVRGTIAIVGLTALLAVLVQSTATLAAPPLWFGLEPGPYAVGFETLYIVDQGRDWCGEAAGCDIKGRPLRIFLWRPAVSGSGSSMVLGDFLAIDPPDSQFDYFDRIVDEKARSTFQRQFFSADRDALAARLAEEATATRRDAEPAKGDFPLVIHSLGRNDFQLESTVLWEYLASHGYTIAVIAQNGPSAENHRVSFSEADMRTQAADILFTANHMLAEDGVFAVIGHSSGAVAAFLAAGETSALKAVVSLDGSITTTDGRSLLEPSGWVSNRATASLLNIYVADKKGLDLWAVEQARHMNRCSWAVERAIHFDFQNWPLYNVLYGVTEERSAAVRSNDRARDVFLASVELAKTYLDSEMKNDRAAREKLLEGPWPAAFGDGLASHSFEPARP